MDDISFSIKYTFALIKGYNVIIFYSIFYSISIFFFRLCPITLITNVNAFLIFTYNFIDHGGYNVNSNCKVGFLKRISLVERFDIFLYHERKII